MTAPARTSPTENINLRATAEQKTLIDRAAARLGKTRTEFVLDATRTAAENALLDQRLFTLDAKTFAAFEAVLDAPVETSDALAKTLTSPAPWDK